MLQDTVRASLEPGLLVGRFHGGIAVGGGAGGVDGVLFVRLAGVASVSCIECLCARNSNHGRSSIGRACKS